jgi:hypothetical protein
MGTTDKAKEFATIFGLILAEVHASHPIRLNLDYATIMDAMGIASPQDKLPSGLMFKEMCRATLDWLIQEQFVHAFGGVQNLTLTTKGLAAMNAVPENLGGPSIAEAIEEAKPDAGSDAGRNRLAAIVGDFIGSAAGAFTKSVSSGG